MAGIFISYRRDDASDVAGRIYDRLASEFGKGRIFKDVDSIPVGTDFGAHIRGVLSQCQVLLALIGPAWPQRRLLEPNDWVRQEIELALSGGLTVIPVIVNDCDIPSADALPKSLRPLLDLNIARVRRDPDFHKDMDDLVVALRQGPLANIDHITPLPRTMDSAHSSAEWGEEIRFERENISLELRRLERLYDPIPITELLRLRALTAGLETKITENPHLNSPSRQNHLHQIEILYSIIDGKRKTQEWIAEEQARLKRELAAVRESYDPPLEGASERKPPNKGRSLNPLLLLLFIAAAGALVFWLRN